MEHLFVSLKVEIMIVVWFLMAQLTALWLVKSMLKLFLLVIWYGKFSVNELALFFLTLSKSGCAFATVTVLFTEVLEGGSKVVGFIERAC